VYSAFVTEACLIYNLDQEVALSCFNIPEAAH